MVSVLIVNYYTGKWLPPLLERLIPDPLVGEVLILNNSPEERLDQVAGREKVRVVEMGENLGFGQAMNRGAALAKGDWWLLINPDTLPEPGCVEALVRAARARGVWVVGPRFYWDEEKEWRLPPATGETMSHLLGQEWAHRHSLDFRVWRLQYQQAFEYFWQQTEPFYQPSLSGACLLIRNESTRFPGGQIFDERFFLYYEDTDLCARMMLQEQFMLCVPAAEVVHYWDRAPRASKENHMQVSLHAYQEKYYPGISNKPRSGISFGFPLPEFEDLGILEQSPTFGANTFEENYWLELGLSPLMSPMAQRDLVPGEAWMSSKTWDRMAAGQFFCQLRPTQTPYPIMRWTWKKGWFIYDSSESARTRPKFLA